MKCRTLIQAGISVALMSIASLASAATVDFSGAGVNNNDLVSQAYGDTADVNLSYRTLGALNNWGPGATQYICTDCNTVRYWNTATFSTDQAIFAAIGDGKLEVRLDAAPGLAFSSVAFHLGTWPGGDTNDSEYRIYSGAGVLLQSLAPVPISGSSAGLLVTFSPPNPDVTSIIFQLGDNWNRGINSLSYETVSAVPLPGALLLMGSGLAGLIGLGRRRFKELVG
jgi:hypothetical protein